MPYFAVVRGRGPAWVRSRPMREQVGWTAHAAFMDALADEGVIHLGGPLANDDSRFLLIFKAENEEAIRTRLAADPWTSMAMLRVLSIEPWQILLGKAD